MLFALLPIAAAGVAWFLSSQAGKADLSLEWRCSWFRTGPSGRYLVFEIVLPDIAARDGDVLILQPWIAGAPITSLHPGFVDDEGHIVTGAKVEHKDGKSVATVAIPFAAFANPVETFEAKVMLIRGGSAHSRNAFEVALPANDGGRRNDLAAICDAAVAAIRQDRDVERSDIGVARRTLVEAFNLDSFGTAMLRERLKAAVATPAQDGWFDPQRIAADIRDDTDAAVLERVMELIVKIAGANGSIGDRGSHYLRLVAGALGLSVAQFDAMIEPFKGINALLAVLGLGAAAERAAVARAYRGLAKTCHPDTQSRASEAERAAAADRFRRITEAYQALMARMPAA